MIQEEPKKGRVYDTQAWRNLCTMARQALPPYCARCGGYIDLSLPANHQMSWTLGHRIEQDLLPDEIKYNPTMEDVQPEHRICGSRAGAQYRNMKAAKNRGVVEQTPHSAALDAYYAVHEIEQLEESARFLEESRHSVLGGSPDSLPEYEQVTPARYESPKHPRAVGSYGQEVIDFAKDVMGVDLYPWQQKVINRMYEHDENGDLTWSCTIISTSRQVGKSVMLACIAAHRVWKEGWNEREYVISMASQRQIARLVWEDAVRRLENGKTPTSMKVHYANGSERLVAETESAPTWRVVACSPQSIAGISASLLICDEAYALDRQVVESAARPTLLTKKQAMTIICSTSGDDSSDLLTTYRDAAIQQFEEENPSLLIMEWSSPLEQSMDDVASWKAASPQWTPEREKMVREFRQTMSDESFASQMLNRWTKARNAAIPESVWNSCITKDRPTEFDEELLCVEASIDGDRIGCVHLQTSGDNVYVDSYDFGRYDDLYAWLRQMTSDHRGIEILVHKALRLPKLPHSVMHNVEASDQIAGFGILMQLIGEHRFLHYDQPELNEQALTCVTHAAGEGRRFISQSKSSRPIYLMRATCWGLARLQEDEDRIKRPSVMA